jgi:hypothetical protein
VPARDPGLAVVASFHHLYEADVAKALLDSFGIEAFIVDEFQSQQRWPTIGRHDDVRLAVAAEHAYRAHQILADDYSDALEEGAEAGDEEP